MGFNKHQQCPHCGKRLRALDDGLPFMSCSCGRMFAKVARVSTKPGPTPHISKHGEGKWAVAVPIGRHPETGKPLIYRKMINGRKHDAEAFRDWIKGLADRGAPLDATISQSDLRQLAALEEKAAAIVAKVAAERAKISAAAKAGASIEPGPLSPPPE